MEDSPHLRISEFCDNEDQEKEGDKEDDGDRTYNISPGETNMEQDQSVHPDLYKHPSQHTDRGWDSFACQYCEKDYTSKQWLERHMQSHALANNETRAYKSNKSIISFGSAVCQLQNEKVKSLDPGGSVLQLPTSPSINPDISTTLSCGDHAAQPDKQGAMDSHHACKYCEKIFTTYTNKRRHERRIHTPHLQQMHEEKKQLPQEKSLHKIFRETAQQGGQIANNAMPAAILENEEEHTEQYMLDVSNNISENLSFYIDGKIVSTSTVSSCEAGDVHLGSSALVSLDALILDPTQISQVLNSDSVKCKDIPGQPVARRRTATPPLLPQIKTELESEVVVSSSSTLVSSLIENVLPQNTESTVVQNERTVFLSPKLKQLLEKQDGLKPTLALITDGQKPCSPLSLSVLPAGTGRFKRRTGSPTSSPQQSPVSHEEMQTPDSRDVDTVSTEEMETQHVSLVPRTSNDKYDRTPPVEDPLEKTETWPPITGGSSCNQQPLDLSNTVRRNEDETLVNAVLDLSLQKKNQGDSELTLNSKEEKTNKCMLEKGELKESRGNPGTPLLTDFTIVTSSDLVTSVEPLAVYGLTLPPTSLAPSPASLTPVALQPASPCTIAFASPASHTMLPAAPSLITVLAPSISNPTQPIQVLGPNMSPKPLVICAENALNSSDCDLTTAFATASSPNLVTLSQPLDSALNLPGHVFLTDQIAINPPVAESAPLSDVPFTSNVTLNDPLINSYNITSNTMLIECTIALETPGSVVPAAITFQENSAEPPVPTQMVVNHIEQQQIVSMPDPQTVDPTILVSSIAESVTLSTTTSVVSDDPPVNKSSPIAEPPTSKEEGPTDSCVSKLDIQCNTVQPSEKLKDDESSNYTASGAQQQTFTKNFICNVCDKLFHSMKELGHHVGDHADEWPYKCEFCVLLFEKPTALLHHRSSLHGVGKTYVCSACTKEFVYLCNLKQHQEELHPGQQCTHTEEEKGKLRPQNYNSSKLSVALSSPDAPQESKKVVKNEEGDEDMAAEELFTSIKIMASDGGKMKGPDVRLGINQHYPSFKPPPFPYHNRSPATSVASATNFTTHNIPQTFSTAIRCTKCGKSFDNMPELHKHILACANASDKRRYTPKKNPIPLRHFAKAQNGVLSTTNSTNELNASNRASHSNRSKLGQESSVKLKFKVLNKRKKKLVHRLMPQRSKSVSASNKVSGQVDEQQEIFVCPHCNREFTMRRSRTKHMAVCPKKPREVKKRKQGGPSVTKENDGHLHRGVPHIEETQQASSQHKTRLQTSGPAKRPAILPGQTVFSNKRSKIIIKESTQTQPESPTFNELPIVRTFNPSMRQYGRVQHGTKGLPIKITIVKPQPTAPQKDELPLTQSRGQATGAASSSPESSATA